MVADDALLRGLLELPQAPAVIRAQVRHKLACRGLFTDMVCHLSGLQHHLSRSVARINVVNRTRTVVRRPGHLVRCDNCFACRHYLLTRVLSPAFATGCCRTSHYTKTRSLRCLGESSKRPKSTTDTSPTAHTRLWEPCSQSTCENSSARSIDDEPTLRRHYLRRTPSSQSQRILGRYLDYSRGLR